MGLSENLGYQKKLPFASFSLMEMWGFPLLCFFWPRNHPKKHQGTMKGAPKHAEKVALTDREAKE
jgi:hypothetical protein